MGNPAKQLLLLKRINLTRLLLGLGTLELFQLPPDGVTTSAGPVVTALADQSGMDHDFAHGVVGEQPDFLAASPPVGGRASIFYDGNDRLVSNDAKSVWAFLHNGDPCTILQVLRPETSGGATNTLNTQRSNPARVGIEVSRQNDGRVSLTVSNGTLFIVNDLNVGSVLPDDVAKVLSIRFETGGSPEYDLRVNGVSIFSGSFSGAPSAADPFGDLTIGNLALGSTSGWIGQIANTTIYSDRLSDVDVAIAEAALSTHYGIA